MKYKCIRCNNYGTNIKTHYIRHLKRKKPCIANNNITCEFLLTYLNKNKKPKLTLTKFVTNKVNKKYICEFCNKSYSTNSHMRRHQKKCINNLNQTTLLQFMSHKLNEKDEQIEKLQTTYNKNIKILMNKINNPIINTTNITNNQINININNYGNENLNYITNEYICKLIKIPYGAIPKLIKYIYFNPNHPENHNIKITNKKLPFASVYKNNKWEVRNKKDVIEDIVDKSYNIIDCEFDNNGIKLSKIQIQRYKKFQNKYDNKEKSLKKQLNKDTELNILNNCLKIV